MEGRQRVGPERAAQSAARAVAVIYKRWTSKLGKRITIVTKMMHVFR